MRFVFSITLLLIITGATYSQNQLLPLSRSVNLQIDRKLSYPGIKVHTSLKPMITLWLPEDSLKKDKKKRKTWFERKLRDENLIVIDSGLFHATADPVFDLEFMPSLTNNDLSSFYRNMRGFTASGDIGKYVSFGTSFFENQAVFPSYIRDYIDDTGVVPGQGREKSFKTNGSDFAFSEAYVSIAPDIHFNIQFGHGKNFIGDGYRSILLSDNAFSYPYLRINTRFLKQKIQYTALYAWLQSMERIPEATTPEALFQRKSASFHYLSLIPLKWLQVGLFESIIWQRWDSTGSKPVNYMFANPLPVINTAMYGFNDQNNALAGINLRLNPFKKLIIYSQFAMDDENKYAWQSGMKIFDLLIKNLDIQVEYNHSDEGMYVHDVQLQSYFDMGQSMAHPFQGNFNEFITFIDLRIRSFILEYKLVNAVNQTLGNNLLYQDFYLAYEVNRASHQKLIAGFVSRLNKEEMIINGTESIHYIYFGFKTDIFNQYFDF